MLEIKDKGYLLKIIQHCDRIQETLSKINKKEFDNSMDYKEIICFNILQIGVLSKKLSDGFINNYNEIPWRLVKGMRDKIVHDYGTIDYDIVWNTANKDIHDLNKYCKKIVK